MDTRALGVLGAYLLLHEPLSLLLLQLALETPDPPVFFVTLDGLIWPNTVEQAGEDVTRWARVEMACEDGCGRATTLHRRRTDWKARLDEGHGGCWQRGDGGEWGEDDEPLVWTS